MSYQIGYLGYFKCMRFEYFNMLLKSTVKQLKGKNMYMYYINPSSAIHNALFN